MEVVWLLDGDTLAGLRRALQPPAATSAPRKRIRISLEGFVTEVYRAVCLRQSAEHGSMGRNQSETRQLVQRMCILFNLVDIDSVGIVDWEQFTDFCVYMRGRDSGNQGLEDEEAGANGEGKGGEGEATRFVEKLGYTDRSSHCREVRGGPTPPLWQRVCCPTIRSGCIDSVRSCCYTSFTTHMTTGALPSAVYPFVMLRFEACVL